MQTVPHADILRKPSRVRVKICGLTRSQDVAAAVAAGADAIGFVCYPSSKRAVSLQQAAKLRGDVPAFVTVVALMVNAKAHAVHEVIDVLKPDLLQFHGDESAEECAGFGQRYLKAFRVGAPGLETASQIATACTAYGDAAGWLFDTYHPAYGGSGMCFDVGLLEDVRRLAQRRPIVLAGGLTAENLPTVVDQVQPYAVDVSSGVEDAPGIKSVEKIRQFVQALAPLNWR